MNKIGVIFFGFLLPIGAFAGNSPLPDGPYVVADGSADIEVAPDYAIIKFNLSNSAKTTAEAAESVEAKTQAVLKVFRGLTIPQQDIRAATVNVEPQYDYSQGKQVYTGQTVSRDIQVTLHDLRKYADLMQGLLDANIDNTEGVEFLTSQEVQDKQQAMDEAIDDAHAQAEEMAKHAGMRLGMAYAVASSKYRGYITSGYPMAFDISETAMMKMAPSQHLTFVAPKTIMISYQVTMVYLMGH